MVFVPMLLLPLAVSALAWCRRRNVGVLTWALRIVPAAAAFPACLCAGWIGGFCFMAFPEKAAPLAVLALIPLVAICVMIVRWPGWRVKAPRNRWLRGAFWGAYACGSAVGALALTVVASAVGFGGFMAYACRTIDCSYATQGEMAGGPRRAASFAKWLPPEATDIRYYSQATYGMCTERLTCRCKEADMIRFAQSHAYPLATNAFTMLEYALPESASGGSAAYRRWEERRSKDPETQHRLVFGERPLPRRFISLTKSHAFDGSSCGGEWRLILVLDLDTHELTGYKWGCWL